MLYLGMCLFNQTYLPKVLNCHFYLIIFYNSKGGHESTVMHLVDTKGADINASTTNDQSTALHMAAAGGFFGVAQCLVFKGCDVFAKSKNGTALDVAQKNDHQKIVALLKPIM